MKSQRSSCSGVLQPAKNHYERAQIQRPDMGKRVQKVLDAAGSYPPSHEIRDIAAFAKRTLVSVEEDYQRACNHFGRRTRLIQ